MNSWGRGSATQESRGSDTKQANMEYVSEPLMKEHLDLTLTAFPLH